jgi:hypothetical protein
VIFEDNWRQNLIDMWRVQKPKIPCSFAPDVLNHSSAPLFCGFWPVFQSRNKGVQKLRLLNRQIALKKPRHLSLKITFIASLFGPKSYPL